MLTAELPLSVLFSYTCKIQCASISQTSRSQRTPSSRSSNAFGSKVVIRGSETRNFSKRLIALALLAERACDFPCVPYRFGSSALGEAMVVAVL